MLFEVRMFSAAANENWWRSRKATPMPWGLTGRENPLKLKDARAKAAELTGEDIPASTIRRWATEGLVSSPSVAANGATGDWPETTVAEVVATWRALHTESWAGRPTREAVRQARKLLLEYRDNQQINDGNEDTLLGGRLEPLIVMWGTTFEKVRNGRPWDEPAEVRYTYQRLSNGKVTRLDQPKFKDAPKDSLALRFRTLN